MKQRCAISVLGSMGYGMACSLLYAGHHVNGFDISDKRMAHFVADDRSSDSAKDCIPALAALERYRRAAEMGLGQEDDAAIVKPYVQEAGLTLPS